MRLRFDFVSNSSSSSFIVLAKDNKYGLLLSNPTRISLRDFCHRYMTYVVSDTNFLHKDKQVYNYINDEAWIKQFFSKPNSLLHTIPLSLKSEHLKCIDACEKLSKSTNNKIKWNDYSNPLYLECIKLNFNLSEKFYELLRTTSDTEIYFDYEEVEDYSIFSKEESIFAPDENDTFYSHEDFINEKINYVFGLTGNKFLFKLNNH